MDSIAFSPPRGPGDGPKLQPVLRQRPPLRSCQLLYNPTARMLGQLESLGGLEMKCSLESRLSLGVKIKTVDTIHFILLLEAAAVLGRATQKRSWISTITTSTSRDPTATVYYTHMASTLWTSATQHWPQRQVPTPRCQAATPTCLAWKVEVTEVSIQFKSSIYDMIWYDILS